MTSHNINVTITEHIDEQVGAKFVARAGEVLNLSVPQEYCRKAADLPQYIQLLGSLSDWAVLKLPAIALLGRLGYRLADDAYDAAKARLTSKPIDTVADAIDDVLTKLPPKAELLAGFNFPDERWGTVLRFNSETDVPRQLAWFIAQGPAIHSVLTQAAGRKEGPVTQGQIEIQPDGSVRLIWYAADYKQRVEVLPPPKPGQVSAA